MNEGVKAMSKAANVRVSAEMHRRLSIISSVTGDGMQQIVERILAAPVAELYRDALRQLRNEQDAEGDADQ